MEEEDDEDKRIDLKRHRNHHYISPKFIIRFALIIGAGAYLLFQVVEVIESKQSLPENLEETIKDSTTIKIEME